MKRLAVLIVSGCFAVSVFGISDIQFTPGGTTPGNWFYDGDVTLSFSQIVNVDIVQGSTADALCSGGGRVFIPDLVFSSGYSIVTPSEPLQIKDSGGNILLSGTLAKGDFDSLFTTAVLYAKYATDFTVTSINNTIGSDFLDTLSVGSTFDFNLTIQGNENFSDILGDGNEHSDGFSGSMSVIPEPATVCLLGLGGLLLFRKAKAKPKKS